MPPYRFLTAVVLSLSALAHAAGAQVLQMPARSGEPTPDPGRTQQQLTIQTDVLGGYDDNLAGPIGGASFAPHPSGYVGFGETTGRYSLGGATRSIDVTGRAYVNAYRNIGLGPSYGGDQTVRAHTSLGRQTQIEVDEAVQYSPYFSLGVFGPLAVPAGAPTPDATPTNGLTETRSWTESISGNLHRRWSRQIQTDAGYAFSNQTYENGFGFDSQRRTASLGLQYSVGRNGDIRASSHRSTSAFTVQTGFARPLNEQAADAGFGYHRRLSRTRVISFSGGVGTSFVETTQYGAVVPSAAVSAGPPLRYSAPSGFGTVRADVGRSWSVSADFRRAVSVLQGIVPAPFMTNAGTISTGGSVGRSVDIVLTAGYSNGAAGQPPASGGVGLFNAYTGTSQFKVKLTRSLSSLVSFDHYQYHLDALASALTGVSSEMRRSAVRVGFTYLLPLLGSSPDVPRAAPGGRD